MTSTATNVLVSDPMRYWVSPSGSCPSSMLRAPHHAWHPSRITAPTSEGVRPSAWPAATQCINARRVAGNSSWAAGTAEDDEGEEETVTVEP
jgi:hypothetical protein